MGKLETEMKIADTIYRIRGGLDRRLGVDPLPFLRHLRNWFLNIRRKLPVIEYTKYKNNLQFLSRKSYLEHSHYYLSKHQTFEEYTADKNNQPKTYIDLNFAVYFQTYNNRQATTEALKSFRHFYPNIPIYLISDHGQDFSDIAIRFGCDYLFASENLGYWPCKNMYTWFSRLADACKKYEDKEWILILEDDVRTRDHISKYPTAHLAGPSGGKPGSRIKHLTTEAYSFTKKRFPDFESNGISGCGGSIFHRESFLKCFNNKETKDFDTFSRTDPRAKGFTDIALTFLFLANGYLVRRWFDMSEETSGSWGPASAFDHQYKKHYN